MPKQPLPNYVVLTGAIFDGTTGVTEKGVVCLTTNDMNGTTNNITIDTFCGQEILPGTIGQTLTVAFRRVWNTDADEISEEFFYAAWMDKSLCQFTVGPLTPVAGDIIYTGTGYVTAYTNTNAANAAPTANMTITCEAPFTPSISS
jgi:hypothetical protein